MMVPSSLNLTEFCIGDSVLPRRSKISSNDGLARSNLCKSRGKKLSQVTLQCRYVRLSEGSTVSFSCALRLKELCNSNQSRLKNSSTRWSRSNSSSQQRHSIMKRLLRLQSEAWHS